MKQPEINTINLKELGYEFHENWELCDIWVNVPAEWCSWENEKWKNIYTKIDLMLDDELMEFEDSLNVFDSEEKAMEAKQLSKIRGAYYYDGKHTSQLLVRLYGVMVIHNEWCTNPHGKVTRSKIEVVDYDLNFNTHSQWVDSSLHDPDEYDEE